MRNIDLQKSRDYYKETLNITLNTMIEMAKCFERTEKYYRQVINKLQQRLKNKGAKEER